MRSVLTIAGSDSSGGAGIQADLRVFAAMGVHGASAITAVTAQNTDGVRGVHGVPGEMVAAQIDAVVELARPAAVKIGMLFDAEVASAVATALERHALQPVVLDPVMVSTSGAALLDASAVDVVRGRLLPMATLITPNLQEAERLLGEPLGSSDADLLSSAHRLRQLGPDAVLLTGGDRGGDADDFLATADNERVLSVERVHTPHTHGTGCTLSAAIAALLARDRDLESAVLEAKEFVTAALEQAYDLSERTGAIHPFFEFYGKEGLP